jgi:hypothetical protein
LRRSQLKRTTSFLMKMTKNKIKKWGKIQVEKNNWRRRKWGKWGMLNLGSKWREKLKVKNKRVKKTEHLITQFSVFLFMFMFMFLSCFVVTHWGKLWLVKKDESDLLIEILWEPLSHHLKWK